MNAGKAFVTAYALAASILLAAHLSAQLPRVFVAFEWDYGEGLVLWQARHIFLRDHAYGPIDEYPHIVYNYPPVYHFAARLFQATGLDLLTAGRLVTLLSTYGVVALGGMLVYWATPRRWGRAARWGGAFVPFLFLYSQPALMWATLMRVDLIAVLLVFAGLSVFVRTPWASKQQYAAFVLFALALYAKQTYVAAPLACIAVSALVNIRLAVRYTLFLVALGGSTLLAFSWWTDGRFPLHLFLYTYYPYSLRRLTDMLQGNVEHMFTLLPLALGSLWMMLGPQRFRVARLRAKLRHSRYRRAIIICGAHTALAFLISFTAGTVGSNLNYFLEWNFAVTLLAALFLAWILSQMRFAGPTSPPLLACAVLPLLFALPHALPAVRHLIRPSGTAAWYQQQSETFAEFVSYVRDLPGPVWSDDMTLLMAAGKEVPLEPWTFRSLSATRVWDERPFVERIRRRFFSAILMKQLEAPISPGMAAALDESYYFGRTVGAYRIYLPKP